MVEEKKGLREIRSRYPFAFAIGVQENSIGFGSLDTNIGIMLAGEIGVGGPISFNFSMRGASAWKLTFSQSAKRTVSPLRVMSPDPFLTRISCWSLFGSLWTMAALSGAKDAVAPATITCDLEPCTYVAVVRSTVPVLTATATLVCC